MKRTIVAFILVISLVLTVLSVSAQNNVAELDTKYTIKENGNICVTASVVNIDTEAGISALFYNVKFDTSVLECVDAKTNIPSKWQQYIDNPDNDPAVVEVFWHQNDEGLCFWWSTFAFFGEGYGISADNEFTIEIEFKPIKNQDTYVEFICDEIYDDADINMLRSLEGESKSVFVKLSEDKETSSESPSQQPPVNSSSSVTSEDHNSSTAVESSNDTNSNISNIENNSSSNIEEGESSITDSSSNISSEDASDDESSALPDESEENNVSENDKSAAESNDDTEEEISRNSSDSPSVPSQDNNEDDDSNSAVWIIVAVVAVIIIAVLVYVFVFVKKKKKV